MLTARRPRITERQVQGVRQLEELLPLLERLHEVGCGRDKAGNRQLFMDQYCLLILLYFFNPIVTSLRGLQQASELSKVQRKLHCPRSSLGSLSEATQVFRSGALAEIVGELLQQVGTLPHDRRLDQLSQRLTDVDGTLLAKLPQITQAAWQSRRHPNGWRLHTHFEVLRGAAVQVTLTDGRNRGPSNEKQVLRQTLAADRCYVMDRGYEQFSLFNAIVAAGSSYVCRIRGDHHFRPQRALPISDEAQRLGVVEDVVGQLGSSRSQRIEHPDHAIRRLRLEITTHPKRGLPTQQTMVLATNLLDAPAEMIAIIYQHRWFIEIFFRFFKHVLGCRHLLSQDAVGIEIQVYCAIIFCLLIRLWTGRQPTLRTVEMIRFYIIGWASEEELFAHLKKLKSVDV